MAAGEREFILSLRREGNPSDDGNANEDYSGVSANYFVHNDTRIEMIVEKLVVYVQSNGALSSDSYGTNITLTKGIDVRHIKNNETISLTDGQRIFINTDWAQSPGELHDLPLAGGSNKAYTFEWVFPDGGLRIKQNEYISVLLEDDFTLLNKQLFKISGYYNI